MTTKQLKLALCVLGTGLMTMPVMANGSKGMDTNIAVEADGITVKGNISDVSGPLIGVSVIVVGTTNGTITDWTEISPWNATPVMNLKYPI